MDSRNNYETDNYFRGVKAAEASAAAEGGVCEAANTTSRSRETAPGGVGSGRKCR